MCAVQLIKDFYTLAAPEKAAEISSTLDELFGNEEDDFVYIGYCSRDG